MRLLLVHGAATTPAVWDGLLPHLAGFDVEAPHRPCTGDLAQEVAFLASAAKGALVVGVGGGATLGLALLGVGAPVAAALLHEPAAGSLVPGLLAHVVRGHAEGGVAGMAHALYGPLWTQDLSPGPEAVARDLAMFRGFEPSPPLSPGAPVVTTVGQLSGSSRFAVARALESRFGLAWRSLPGCGHAVHLERPDVLAAEVRATAERCA